MAAELPGKRSRPRNDDEVAALESELAEKRKKLQELDEEEEEEEEGETAEGEQSEGEEDEAIALYDSDSEAILAMETDQKPVMEPVSPPESQQQDSLYVEDQRSAAEEEEEEEEEIAGDGQQEMVADDENEEPLQVTVQTKHRIKLKKETSRERHREKHADRSGRSGRKRSVESIRSLRGRKSQKSSRDRKKTDKQSEREKQREERDSEHRTDRQRTGTSGKASTRDEHHRKEERYARQTSRREQEEGHSWRKEHDLREELRRRVTVRKEKEKRKEEQTEEEKKKEQSSESSDSRSNEEEKISSAGEEEAKPSEESSVEEKVGNSDISEENEEGLAVVEPPTPPGRENPQSDSDVDVREHLEDVSSEGEVEVVDGTGGEKMLSHTPEPQPDVVTYYPAISGCRSLEKEYEYLNRIEEGTYGVVYRARERKTNDIVALKKVKMEREKEGFPITSLREINMLLKSEHPNIVHVREIVVGDNMDKIYIVMEYVEHDLKTLMESMKQPFLVGETKTLMLQLLRAVQHLHDNWILHRDLKASNLLLSHKGILKVGDFGLAREYGSPLKNYTQLVVTLWYRAPELLLGAKKYSTAVDMWSVGCVFGELLGHAPMFPGKSEIDQINKIFKELGTPSDKIWPGWTELPAVKKVNFAKQPYNNLRNRYPFVTESGLDLLNKLLTYDPTRRITADEALKHQFFKESPLPVDPSMFPTWPAKSELPRSRKHASPTAPKGGRELEEVEGADGDGGHGFHMGLAKSGHAAKGAGFSLRF